MSMHHRHFEAETGLLDARVFAAPDVFRAEQDRLFRRAWLFVGPADWLTEPGDYLVTSLGELPAIAWVRSDGALRVFVNRCPAGIGAMVADDRGNAGALRCACHGRSYDPDGGELAAIPRLECFSGFVFACQDPDASPLVDQIGEFAWWWDVIDRHFPGGVQVVGETSLRAGVSCNWKLGAEACCGDTFSDFALSRSTLEVLDLGPPLTERIGLQAATEGGAIAVEYRDSIDRDDPRDAMIPLMATLFPNISFDARGNALHVWHPRGPTETEVQTFALAGRNESLEVKRARRRRCQALFGPAGLIAQDQHAVWSSISANARSRTARTLNLQGGWGGERRANLPGRLADLASEMNQRAFYGWWQAQFDKGAPPSRLGGIKIGRHVRQQGAT